MATPFRALATGTHHAAREARHEATVASHDPAYTVLMAVIVAAGILKNGYLIVSWARSRRRGDSGGVNAVSHPVREPEAQPASGRAGNERPAGGTTGA